MTEDRVRTTPLLLALCLGAAGMGLASLIRPHPWAVLPCLGCWCGALVLARCPARWLAVAVVLALIVAGTAAAVEQGDLAAWSLRSAAGLASLAVGVAVATALPAGLAAVKRRKRKRRIAGVIGVVNLRTKVAFLGRSCSRTASRLAGGARSAVRVARLWWRPMAGTAGVTVAVALCLGGSAPTETRALLVAFVTMVLGTRLLRTTVQQLSAAAGGGLVLAGAAEAIAGGDPAEGLGTAAFLAVATAVMVGVADRQPEEATAGPNS